MIALADLVVDTTGRTVEQVADEVLTTVLDGAHDIAAPRGGRSTAH